MSIAQSLLPEFDHEMGQTRRMLERIPEDQLNFKPDPRSMTLARLAGHLGEMPLWALTTLDRTELDVTPSESSQFEALVATSRQQLLAAFDKNVAGARAAVAAASDQDLLTPWSLISSGKVRFTMPRVAVLRGMVMNHMVHHRGQLTVYFRLTGIPVPALYGPSADEGTL